MKFLSLSIEKLRISWACSLRELLARHLRPGEIFIDCSSVWRRASSKEAGLVDRKFWIGLLKPFRRDRTFLTNRIGKSGLLIDCCQSTRLINLSKRAFQFESPNWHTFATLNVRTSHWEVLSDWNASNGASRLLTVLSGTVYRASSLIDWKSCSYDEVHNQIWIIKF